MHPCKAIHSEVKQMGRKAGNEISIQNSICKNNICKQYGVPYIPISLSSSFNDCQHFLTFAVIFPNNFFSSHFFPPEDRPCLCFHPEVCISLVWTYRGACFWSQKLNGWLPDLADGFLMASKRSSCLGGPVLQHGFGRWSQRCSLESVSVALQGFL